MILLLNAFNYPTCDSNWMTRPSSESRAKARKLRPFKAPCFYPRDGMIAGTSSMPVDPGMGQFINEFINFEFGEVL